MFIRLNFSVALQQCPRCWGRALGRPRGRLGPRSSPCTLLYANDGHLRNAGLQGVNLEGHYAWLYFTTADLCWLLHGLSSEVAVRGAEGCFTSHQGETERWWQIFEIRTVKKKTTSLASRQVRRKETGRETRQAQWWDAQCASSTQCICVRLHVCVWVMHRAGLSPDLSLTFIRVRKWVREW